MSGSSEPVSEERFIDVGGARLHVRRCGAASGLPTLVLEAGGGSTLQTWSALERGLAPHTQVFSYERAGIGASTGKVDGITAPAVTERLAVLLDVTAAKAPYLLVGHSLGGLFMRYFASTRPQSVAGLVLLDATPQKLKFPSGYFWKPWLIMWLMFVLAKLGLLQRIAARHGAGSAQLSEIMGRAHHVRAVLAEIAVLRDIQAEVAALPLDALAKLPILAISAGQHPSVVPPESVEEFRRSHERFGALGLKPYSRHVRMENATHMSMLTDPAQAAIVAAEIIEFSRQITERPPA